jgi:hypothetical protein
MCVVFKKIGTKDLLHSDNGNSKVETRGKRFQISEWTKRWQGVDKKGTGCLMQ